MTGVKKIAKPINAMEKVKIEVWSDVVCPSCYIGMQQLKQAVSSLNAKGDVEIVLRSFQLDPDFPKNKSKKRMACIDRLPFEPIGYSPTFTESTQPRVTQHARDKGAPTIRQRNQIRWRTQLSSPQQKL